MSRANPVVRSTSHCDVFTKCPNFGGWAHLANIDPSLDQPCHSTRPSHLVTNAIYRMEELPEVLVAGMVWLRMSWQQNALAWGRQMGHTFGFDFELTKEFFGPAAGSKPRRT